MRKLATMSIAMILVAQFVFSASSFSATTKSFVDDGLFVTYNFAGFNESVYNQIKNNAQFNASTIPGIIVDTMVKRNLKQVTWGLPPQPILYNDGNRTVDASFFLSGSDIISYSMNQTSINRTYKVTSDWQKFQVSLTSNVSVNFGLAFDKTVSEWQRMNYTDASQNVHPAFYYRSNQTSTADVSFYLVLPSAAFDVRVEGGTVMFQMPALLGDQLLSSPLLVLAALIIVMVIVLLYRKAR
jgi:hypothetical protein